MWHVLRDADDSLACWLASMLPAGTRVDFAAPGMPDGERGPAGGAVPTVHIHLHRIRECPEGSAADWAELRSVEGLLVGRLPPARQYRLTYLLTADAGSTPAEHELLGHLLAGSVVTQVIPPHFLRGSLVADPFGDPPTVLARFAPEESACDPTALWALWRVPPRAYLEASLLVPLQAAAVTQIPEPPREIELASSRRDPGGTGPAAAGPQPPRQAPRRRPSVSEG